jgi:hypothetical protein
MASDRQTTPPAAAVEIAANAMCCDANGSECMCAGQVLDCTWFPTATAALRALAAAGWTLTPPGWVAVPKEPTQGMANEGSRHLIGQLGPAVLCYRAMLAAAPQAMTATGIAGAADYHPATEALISELGLEAEVAEARPALHGAFPDPEARRRFVLSHFIRAAAPKP